MRTTSADPPDRLAASSAVFDEADRQTGFAAFHPLVNVGSDGLMSGLPSAMKLRRAAPGPRLRNPCRARRSSSSAISARLHEEVVLRPAPRQSESGAVHGVGRQPLNILPSDAPTLVVGRGRSNSSKDVVEPFALGDEPVLFLVMTAQALVALCNPASEDGGAPGTAAARTANSRSISAPCRSIVAAHLRRCCRSCPSPSRAAPSCAPCASSSAIPSASPPVAGPRLGQFNVELHRSTCSGRRVCSRSWDQHRAAMDAAVMQVVQRVVGLPQLVFAWSGDRRGRDPPAPSVRRVRHRSRPDCRRWSFPS